ncbi:hypothetical protein L2E82_03492 [Cichorium intybus]|uniref:Uncharacterized protein n=1 Tax=Cichorium intybus TaxID=13427 RepID=A0ACB9H3M5_CICIN|nr:hypothetical protein L2E82_03492 [Cichorium intybus]
MDSFSLAIFIAYSKPFLIVEEITITNTESLKSIDKMYQVHSLSKTLDTNKAKSTHRGSSSEWQATKKLQRRRNRLTEIRRHVSVSRYKVIKICKYGCHVGIETVVTYYSRSQ